MNIDKEVLVMGVEVLGLGASAMDIMLQCEALPKEDGFSFIHQEKLLPGGSCANVLVTLAQLKAKTALVAQMGDDHYGKLFIEDLAQQNVKTDYIQCKEGGTSLHTFVSVAAQGAKAISCNLGDSLMTLAEDTITKEMLEGVKVFYTDMFPVKPALQAVRYCKEMGVKLAVNLQCSPSFMQLCGVEDEEIKEMFSVADIIFGCREGFLELAGTTDFYEAGRMIYEKYRPKEGLVFTIGDKGSIYFNQQEVLEIPAYQVESVDTTGAGDAFNGGFIYAYFLQKQALKESLKFANACAALKCSQVGARLKATEADICNIINK